MEECLDGWAFDQSEFLSTTVSEVTKWTPAFVFSPAFIHYFTGLGSNHHEQCKQSLSAPHLNSVTGLSPAKLLRWMDEPSQKEALPLLVQARFVDTD